MVGRRWRWLRLGLLAAGAALVVWLFARVGVEAPLGLVRRAGGETAWLLVVYAAGTALVALPWRWLLPAGSRPGLRATVLSRFAAAGVNAIDPLLGVGGEPVRLLWLPRRDRAVGAAAIIVDRLLFVVASALFLAGGAILALVVSDVPRRYVVVGAALGGAMLLAAATTSRLGARYGVVVPVRRLLRRLRARDPSEVRRSEVDARLAVLWRSPRTAAGALAVHLAGRAALAAEVLVGFVVLGVPLDPARTAVLVAVPVVIAVVGAAVPGQLGVQEGGQALACRLIGIDPAVGIAVVLLQRVRQAVFVAAGAVLVAARARRPADDVPTRASAGGGPAPRP